VTYNTLSVPKFQVMCFVYHSCDTHVFEMPSVFLENLWRICNSCRRTCDNKMVFLWCVLIDCCVQNIQNRYLSSIVGMFQNEFHIALYNKCDINVKAGVLYEEYIIQNVCHVIHPGE
jgi:hypothetical protein